MKFAEYILIRKQLKLHYFLWNRHSACREVNLCEGQNTRLDIENKPKVNVWLLTITDVLDMNECHIRLSINGEHKHRLKQQNIVMLRVIAAEKSLAGEQNSSGGGGARLYRHSLD